MRDTEPSYLVADYFKVMHLQFSECIMCGVDNFYIEYLLFIFSIFHCATLLIRTSPAKNE